MGIYLAVMMDGVHMRINRLIEMMVIIIEKKGTTVKYLSDYFSVSRKTIYGDLDILLTSGIPVVYGDGSGVISIVEGYDLLKNFSPKTKEIKDEKVLYYKYHDNEKNVKYTLEKWEDFVAKRQKGDIGIDSATFNSWIRCQHNNTPIYDIDTDNLVAPEELSKYSHVGQNLLDADGLELFSKIIGRIKWYGQVYDVNRNLVAIINLMDNYERLYPRLGYSRSVSEEKVGTNSVDLALREQKTMMILGPEHYNKAFHDVCNISSPLYKNNELFGVLNFTFVHVNVNPQAEKLVSSFARLFEGMVLGRFAIDKSKERILHGNDEDIYKRDKKNLVGKSAKWKTIMKLCDNISLLDCNVSIKGESGVGKVSIGKHIHHQSTRKYGPCIVLDLAKVREVDHREKLFGSDKHKGVIEEAQSGTLILKNVSVLSKKNQQALAYFLENDKIRRIASKNWVMFDVKVIICQSKHEKAFDEKILASYPLVEITIPDLASRQEDFEAIVEATMGEYFKAKSYTKMDEREFIENMKRKNIDGSVAGLKRMLKIIKESE